MFRIYFSKLMLRLKTNITHNLTKNTPFSRIYFTLTEPSSLSIHFIFFPQCSRLVASHLHLTTDSTVIIVYVGGIHARIVLTERTNLSLISIMVRFNLGTVIQKSMHGYIKSSWSIHPD